MAARAAQLAALATLVGAYAFLLLVARPAARAGGEAIRTGLLAALDARLRILVAGALALALIAGVVDLWRLIALATGGGLRDSLDVARALAVLLETRFGLVWVARHVLLALLAAVLALAEERDDADWLALRGQALGLSAASLVLGAATGHAASADAGVAALVADAIHLLAGALWAGGLLPLALTLAWTARLPAAEAMAVGAAAGARFSRLALGAVTALAITGLFATWEQLGGIPGLLGTSYGRWLLLKLALFLAVLGVAAGNRLVWLPRLERGAATAAGAVVWLRRTLLAEAGLATAILIVVAVLGLTTPGRHTEVVWPLPFRLDWEATKALPGVRPRVAVGSQLATFGLVALLLAVVLRPRRWRLAGAAGSLAILLGAGVALPPLAVDAYPTTYWRPTVPYTAASIVQGAALYRAHCAGCHGPAGRGDGPGGAGLPRRPADLTAQHAADHTAGDMFWWISHGIAGAGMPGFGDRLSPDERWDLVNFVRALSAAERARELGPEASPRALVVAPDFGFTAGVGEERALRDWRGRGVVVLVFFTLPASAERLVRLSEASLPLRLAGGELIGVPLREERALYRALGPRPVYFPLAVDGAAEAAAAYALFGRAVPIGDPDGRGLTHMELLVDRQGYLRARWIPRDPAQAAGGWTDPADLIAQVARLAREAPRTPVAAEHVH